MHTHHCALSRVWISIAALVMLAPQLQAGDQGKAGADNNAMVERGRYLVTVGGCNDCHTPKIMGPSGPVFDETRTLSGHPADAPVAPFPEGVPNPAGWLAATNVHLSAWAGPWGVSFARNLTPDVATGIGSWTEAMFVKALRTGKDMGEGRAILPPMPWENFGKMTDEDLQSIFAYLRSLPPIENHVPDPLPPPMHTDPPVKGSEN